MEDVQLFVVHISRFYVGSWKAPLVTGQSKPITYYRITLMDEHPPTFYRSWLFILLLPAFLRPAGALAAPCRLQPAQETITFNGFKVHVQSAEDLRAERAKLKEELKASKSKHGGVYFGVYIHAGTAIAGWFVMENPVQMDDLGIYCQVFDDIPGCKYFLQLPVIARKAVAEVSKIGNL